MQKKNAHSNTNEDQTAEQIAEQTADQIAVQNATTRRAHELKIGKEIKICGKRLKFSGMRSFTAIPR